MMTTVLAYHEILSGSRSYKYCVAPATFEEHLGVLTDRQVPAQPVQVTFDDGHISHYRNALPLLEQFGVKAIFYVTAGWTGTQPDYMDASHLRELVARGHRLGAHGWSHKMLTLCSPSELLHELRHSKELLEDLTGTSVDQLSIPHGRWNDRVLEVCAQTGYKDVYVSEAHLQPVERFGIRLIGRLMVTNSLSADKMRRILGKVTSGYGYHIKDRVKGTLKAVVGDRMYHRLWRVVADPHGCVKLDGGDSAGQPICVAAAPAKSTKVLHLISSGGYYGAESMLVNLVTSLGRLQCDSVIGVFQNSQSPHIEIAERAREMGLTAEVIPCHGRLDWRAVEQIRNLIYKYGVDLVHTHGSKPNSYAALAVRTLSVPLVATYHLDWPDRGVALYSYHLLDRLVLRRFQKVVAVSDPIERSLRRSGLSQYRLMTIANGIDIGAFKNAPPLTVNARLNPNDPLVIGVVGRLTPQKGHRYLLAVVPEILSAFPNTVVRLFGDGPQRGDLERLVRTLGIERNVTFAGACTDMPAVYHAIDILVLPSINEGLPMTLIEAMAAQRPVVATDVGDVPKLIRDEQTGLLVNAGDEAALKAAILRLIAEPNLRSTLALQGQRWVTENFSADAMARSYCDVYRDVLSTRS